MTRPEIVAEWKVRIAEVAVRTGDAKKWWSLKTTHMFAAYWRARLRGLIRANDSTYRCGDEL